MRIGRTVRFNQKNIFSVWEIKKERATCQAAPEKKINDTPPDPKGSHGSQSEDIRREVLDIDQ
eukprot:12902813-Prorocentrum_lima.AAC.1